MSDLRDLYQEMILDHHKRPRNSGAMADADRVAEGYNPLCGDRITVYVKTDGGVVRDVRFQGSGCAISTASASMMTEQVKGKVFGEVEDMFRRFHALVTGSPGQAVDLAGLGKLAVFSGVCEFPARVKCASLAWHTLNAAMHGEQGRPETVSTE